MTYSSTTTTAVGFPVDTGFPTTVRTQPVARMPCPLRIALDVDHAQGAGRATERIERTRTPTLAATAVTGDGGGAPPLPLRTRAGPAQTLRSQPAGGLIDSRIGRPVGAPL